MKRIRIKTIGGPFDGTHICDFDMDFGLTPPNRFVVEIHKVYNRDGVGALASFQRCEPVLNSNAGYRKNSTHQYWLESASETADFLDIVTYYVA